MRRAWAVGAAAALALAGCGRLDFPSQRDAGPTTDATRLADATTDARGDAAPPAPLAFYAFDEQGGPATDSSGNGLDASCAGGSCPARLTPGRLGAARTFTGAGERLLVDDTRLTLTTGFTVAAFVRQRVTNNVGTVLAKPHATGVGAAFELALAASDTWFCTRPALAVGDEECLLGPPLPLDQWVHLALTWDGATKRLYLDGVIAAEAPGVTTFDGSPLLLGSDAEDGQPSTTPFTGDLDEVHLFDRALAAAEVAALAAR